MRSDARRCATVVTEISAKGLGMTCVVDDDGRLAGVITDGDLRRHMALPDLLDAAGRPR
ncbi:MAG: CBS domain-containing protein [Desulfomicrobium escambiense]|nr:CBS domain-containing protein [Desulfomicrobium escambiense]